MADMLVVVLLAIATTCQGAALPSQTRLRREKLADKFDWSIDDLGVHIGLKYMDTAQPLNGGNVHIQIDDLQKIFKHANSNKVDLNVEVDLGAKFDDVLFKIVVNYLMVQIDGNGEEKGRLSIECKTVGDLWTTTIQTLADPIGGNLIIPAAISNMELKMETDRKTKLYAKYANPTKNQEMHIHIIRTSCKSATLEIINGDIKHNLAFKVGKELEKMVEIKVEGTSLGDSVEGTITESKSDKGQSVKLEVNLQKDGTKFVDITVDTTTSPYKFKLIAPNFLKRWDIKESSLEMTIDHQIDKSIAINANIFGGIHLEIKHVENANGGKDVSVVVQKDVQQMFKMDLSTEKVDNDHEYKLSIHVAYEVNPESILYKKIISQYKLKNPLKILSCEFEFHVNKKDTSGELNKFSVKGEIMTDDTKALEVLITTNENPYRFYLFAPAFLEGITEGMTEAKISFEHNPGQLLKVETNFDKFTGFNISKTRSGREFQIEVNGKELSTDLEDGNYLEPINTWEREPLLVPEITIEFLCFIPQSIGKPWSSFNFGEIPKEMENRKDYWFKGPPDLAKGTMYATTNDRQNAGEEGGFKIKTTLKMNPLNIGNLTEGNLMQTTEVGPSQVVHVKEGQIIPGSFREQTAPTQANEIKITNSDLNTSIICFKAKAAFPFTDLPLSLTPAADYHVCVELTHHQNGYTIAMKGTHDLFPAYEARIDSEVVYEVYPTDGPGIMNLGFWSSEFIVPSRNYLIKGPSSFQAGTRTDDVNCTHDYDSYLLNAVADFVIDY